MKLSIESPCFWFSKPFPRNHCVTVFVISNRFGTTLCILSILYLYLFPTGSVLRGALLAGRLVGSLPNGSQHEQALLCRVPLCACKVTTSTISFVLLTIINLYRTGKWTHMKKATQRVTQFAWHRNPIRQWQKYVLIIYRYCQRWGDPQDNARRGRRKTFHRHLWANGSKTIILSFSL